MRVLMFWARRWARWLWARGLRIVPFLLAFAPLMTYLADAGTTLFRRFMAGEQVVQGRTGTHTYQRLTDVGFSHLGSDRRGDGYDHFGVGAVGVCI